jgi:hypothetical protein
VGRDQKASLRRGSVATLELLRATDLGAKKAFTVRLQRVKKTEEMQVNMTLNPRLKTLKPKP